VIDHETQHELKVSVEGSAGAYLTVPLDQLPNVRRVLENNGIVHFISQDVIELDGRPPIAIIDFARGADTCRIQAALDAA
jgi:hypothetical protein